tara:strand:- start:288 stop:917 length:630 start_codon:yes stop_codon:yes gene_type:complete
MKSSINELSQSIKERISKPLPGRKAHRLTKVISKNDLTFSNTYENAIPASVLILLFPFEKEIQFFLTQRTESVEHHKGQISLPGGMCEGNESLCETALRETEEEIGVNRNKVELLGSLTPFFVPITGYIIHPYIGWCKEKPLTKIYKGEVDKLFSISINELLDKNIIVTEEWSIRGYDASVPYYNFGLCKVWGATAAILSEFKVILEEI